MGDGVVDLTFDDDDDDDDDNGEAEAAVVTSSSSKKKKIHGFCDICLHKDRKPYKEFILQKCCQCGVLVHKQCYGILVDDFPDVADDNFTCWPCKSIGKRIKLKEKNSNGKRLAMIPKKRPTECCLCSVSDGIHAMHPLYDYSGQKGRHVLVREQDGKRLQKAHLAWVHTLCALAINFNMYTRGCVFGCNQEGLCDEDSDSDDDGKDDDDNDNESVNSELQADRKVRGDSDIHHFVIPTRKLNGKDDDWIRRIRLHRKELKCYLCGKTDKYSLRIPLQCSAHNESEYKDLVNIRRERNKIPDEACSQAVHAGCAMWGRNEFGEMSIARRLFYFPGGKGENGEEDDTFTELYCDRHAKELYSIRPEICGMEKRLLSMGEKVAESTTTTARRQSKINNNSNQRQRNFSNNNNNYNNNNNNMRMFPQQRHSTSSPVRSAVSNRNIHRDIKASSSPKNTVRRESAKRSSERTIGDTAMPLERNKRSRLLARQNKEASSGNNSDNPQKSPPRKQQQEETNWFEKIKKSLQKSASSSSLYYSNLVQSSRHDPEAKQQLIDKKKHWKVVTGLSPERFKSIWERVKQELLVEENNNHRREQKQGAAMRAAAAAKQKKRVIETSDDDDDDDDDENDENDGVDENDSLFASDDDDDENEFGNDKEEEEHLFQEDEDKDDDEENVELDNSDYDKENNDTDDEENELGHDDKEEKEVGSDDEEEKHSNNNKVKTEHGNNKVKTEHGNSDDELNNELGNDADEEKKLNHADELGDNDDDSDGWKEQDPVITETVTSRNMIDENDDDGDDDDYDNEHAEQETSSIDINNDNDNFNDDSNNNDGNPWKFLTFGRHYNARKARNYFDNWGKYEKVDHNKFHSSI